MASNIFVRFGSLSAIQGNSSSPAALEWEAAVQRRPPGGFKRRFAPPTLRRRRSLSPDTESCYPTWHARVRAVPLGDSSSGDRSEKPWFGAASEFRRRLDQGRCLRPRTQPYGHTGELTDVNCLECGSEIGTGFRLNRPDLSTLPVSFSFGA